MYTVSRLHNTRYKFSAKYMQEILFFFNTTTDEVGYMWYSGVNFYICSQLYRLYEENTLILPSCAYTEQSSLFLSHLGYLQTSNRITPAMKQRFPLWEAMLIFFVACSESIVTAFNKEAVSVGAKKGYKKYISTLIGQTLFSQKTVDPLNVKNYLNLGISLLFISPLTGYITNFYVNNTITRLSMFMAFCSQQAKSYNQL
jgi:hypothetical protein